MPAVHLLIKGKVQGVFFRATAKKIAEQMGITGWVKNTDAGDVEAVACGSNEQLQQFISWCKKGPEKAVVTSVEVKNIEEQSFSGFKVQQKWR